MLDRSVLAEAPLRRLLQGAVARVAGLRELVHSPRGGGYDPQQQKPAVYVAHYGPIGLQTARRYGSTGHEALATLVDPGVYLTPNDGDNVVSASGVFRLCSMAMFSSLSWTYTTATGGGWNHPVDPKAAGGLLEPVRPQNGGAIIFNNFSGRQNLAGTSTTWVRPRLCVEVDFWDMTRGVSVSGGIVPAETLVAGHYGFQELPEPMDFPHGTALQPRVYVTECRMGDTLDGTTRYNAASVAAWLQIVMKGFIIPSESAP